MPVVPRKLAKAVSTFGKRPPMRRQTQLHALNCPLLGNWHWVMLTACPEGCDGAAEARPQFRIGHAGRRGA